MRNEERFLSVNATDLRNVVREVGIAVCSLVNAPPSAKAGV